TAGAAFSGAAWRGAGVAFGADARRRGAGDAGADAQESRRALLDAAAASDAARRGERRDRRHRRRERVRDVAAHRARRRIHIRRRVVGKVSLPAVSDAWEELARREPYFAILTSER